jgi:hypothetical protein
VFNTKVWILHDTKYGNGKNLAELMGQEFPAEYEVKIGDIKLINPQVVADDSPDVLLLGGAIRMFMGAPKSKKWMKDLGGACEKKIHKISYGATFLTHVLPAEKIHGYGKRMLNKVKNSLIIEKSYSKCLFAQVSAIEGPFKSGEVDKAKEFVKDLVDWF